MTFAELKAALEKLTPEQLALPARWSGEERGGEIDALELTDEDCLLDEGDTGELFLRSDLEDQCLAFGGKERLAAAVVTCPKGTPLLFTDFGDNGLPTAAELEAEPSELEMQNLDQHGGPQGEGP